MSASVSEVGAMRVDNTTGEILTAVVKDKALHADCTDGVNLEVSGGKLQLKDSTSATDGILPAKMGYKAGKWVGGDLADSDAGGGVLSVQNGETDDLYIVRLVVLVQTASTGACTVDFGIGASATTSNDSLIDDLDVNATTGIFDNIADKGTSGGPTAVWTSGQYLTGSMASGAAAGLVGKWWAYVIAQH